MRIVAYRCGMPKAEESEIFTITAAQRALSQEQTGRTRRYLISMAIRTACVVAAIFVPGWPRWVLIAGAVVLPYLAVVVANAGRENDEPGDNAHVPDVYRPELPAPGLAIGDTTEVVMGDWASDSTISGDVIRVEPVSPDR